MDGIRLVRLNEKYLPDIATLFCSKYQKLMNYSSLLPLTYKEIDNIIPILENALKEYIGVIAIKNDNVIGYLLGQTFLFHEKKTVYIPEWAHSILNNNTLIYQEMYNYFLKEWIEEKCKRHLISIFANDNEIINNWIWSGFRPLSIDAIRDLEFNKNYNKEAKIYSAKINDIDIITNLNYQFEKYISGPPTFLKFEPRKNEKYFMEMLESKKNLVFLASYQNIVVGYMIIGQNSSETIILRDNKISYIKGAFINEQYRKMGIGSALLNQGLDWAKSNGYNRCAVDFEPENIYATRFWLNHFKPICYTFVRDIY